jgi:hypothetical protein
VRVWEDKGDRQNLLATPAQCNKPLKQHRRPNGLSSDIALLVHKCISEAIPRDSNLLDERGDRIWKALSIANLFPQFLEFL